MNKHKPDRKLGSKVCGQQSQEGRSGLGFRRCPSSEPCKERKSRVVTLRSRLEPQGRLWSARSQKLRSRKEPLLRGGGGQRSFLSLGPLAQATSLLSHVIKGSGPLLYETVWTKLTSSETGGSTGLLLLPRTLINGNTVSARAHRHWMVLSKFKMISCVE